MARLLNFFKKDSLTKRLEEIKAGDKDEREKLIEEYLPFIVKTVSNKLNRYIESENSEEYSVGMEAFNEAIDKYENTRGGFIGFAELVIHSRITDYMRKMKKNNAAIPISQLEQDGIDMNNHFKMEDFTKSYELKDEIKALEKELGNFDISFSDLVQEAPKHIDTRINALCIARYIVENKELKEELFRKKTIPSSRLVEELQITPKVLKRSRKFIIATVLILNSDLELLKHYIYDVGGGVVHGL